MLNNQDYVTVTRPNNAGEIDSIGKPVNESFYGDLSIPSDRTVAEFYANVEELVPTVTQQGGAPVQSRVLQIIADSRDTDAVDIGDRVTINNLDNGEFVVTNIYESNWRWMNTIIVEYSNR